MLCIDFEWFEFSAAARIELAEEFNELQPVGMNIRAERVDSDIQSVTDDEDQGEHDNADHSVAHHGADLVEHLSDNAGRKTEREQSAVGQDIAEIAGRAVKTVGAL